MLRGSIWGPDVGAVVALVMKGHVRSVALFRGGHVVRATVHGRLRARDRSTTVAVTVGRPNYGEREFLKRNPKASIRTLPLRKAKRRGKK